jgi:hypothetical protein
MGKLPGAGGGNRGGDDAGGGGGNGGGGGDGGGGGGSGGGGSGPPAGTGPTADAPDPSLQWQFNPKLNVSIFPVWDGKDETIIDYVINMASLALLSPLMFVHIVQMAPMKFTGRARSWWTLLPPNSRVLYSRDWSHLLDALRRHFLTAKWLADRLQEFEEM